MKSEEWLPSVDEPAEQRWIGSRDLTRWRSGLGRALVRLAVRTTRVLDSHTVMLVTAVIGAVVIGSMAVASGEVYESVVEGDDLAVVDQPILAAAVASRTPGSARLVTMFTDLGGTVGMPIIAVLATVLLVYLRRTWTPLVVVGLAAGGSLLFTVVGKQLVGRTRPPLMDAVPPYESSPSFPSGHTLNSTVIAAALAYLALPLLRRLATRIVVVGLAVAWAVTMGLSRVWLGHHWFTDVVVGWTMGLAWIGVIITAHRLYLTLHHRPRVD